MCSVRWSMHRASTASRHTRVFCFKKNHIDIRAKATATQAANNLAPRLGATVAAALDAASFLLPWSTSAYPDAVEHFTDDTKGRHGTSEATHEGFTSYPVDFSIEQTKSPHDFPYTSCNQSPPSIRAYLISRHKT